MDYEKAVEELADRYWLVTVCEENGLPYARETREEGRFAAEVVAKAAGKEYRDVLADVRARAERAVTRPR